MKKENNNVAKYEDIFFLPTFIFLLIIIAVAYFFLSSETANFYLSILLSLLTLSVEICEWLKILFNKNLENEIRSKKNDLIYLFCNCPYGLSTILFLVILLAKPFYIDFISFEKAPSFISTIAIIIVCISFWIRYIFTKHSKNSKI